MCSAETRAYAQIRCDRTLWPSNRHRRSREGATQSNDLSTRCRGLTHSRQRHPSRHDHPTSGEWAPASASFAWLKPEETIRHNQTGTMVPEINLCCVLCTKVSWPRHAQCNCHCGRHTVQRMPSSNLEGLLGPAPYESWRVYPHSPFQRCRYSAGHRDATAHEGYQVDGRHPQFPANCRSSTT